MERNLTIRFFCLDAPELCATLSFSFSEFSFKSTSFLWELRAATRRIKQYSCQPERVMQKRMSRLKESTTWTALFEGGWEFHSKTTRRLRSGESWWCTRCCKFQVMLLFGRPFEIDCVYLINTVGSWSVFSINKYSQENKKNRFLPFCKNTSEFSHFLPRSLSSRSSLRRTSGCSVLCWLVVVLCPFCLFSVYPHPTTTKPPLWMRKTSCIFPLQTLLWVNGWR